MKNLLSYFFKTIIIIFIFALMPIVLFLLISSRSSILFGLRTFTVLTGSMEPRIHVASMVIVAPAASYALGDIITFNRGSITVTHRIAGMKNGAFITKGDANKIADPQLVSPKDIIGKDYVIIPVVGRFTEFLKTPLGFSIFIGLPTIIFVGFELW